jgi:predicted oxidoreductase (fatty acid repression mutant protein)
MGDFAYSLRVMCKFTLCFTPYPLFQWYLQSKKILLNLVMKCQNSAFNAQGSRVIIVLVQVKAVKIYVAPVEETLKKKERQDETQFTNQNWWKN